MLNTIGTFAAKLAYPLWYAVDTIQGSIARNVRENCYDQGMPTAVCERLGHEAYNNSMNIMWYGAASLAMTYTVIQYGKSIYSQYQYQKYKEKPEAEVNRLSDNQKCAFQQGAHAATNSFRKIKSLFNYESWRHVNAYYAGLEATKANDRALIEKIKPKNR